MRPEQIKIEVDGLALSEKLMLVEDVYPNYLEMQFFESVWNHNTALQLLRMASHSLQTAPCLVIPARLKNSAFPNNLGIWDSIETSNVDIPVSQWQKKELDKRYKSYQEGTLELHDWDTVHNSK